MADSICDVQEKILEIMLYIDTVCRKNDIKYYIMGGTALGAVRHKGFIPWDDDLDIFMTPDNYERFSQCLSMENNDKFHLQEWKIADNYIEYAKLRMNGTTFIEEQFRDNRNMHHGIYVDIMMLHKCSRSLFKQCIIYLCSKFVTLVALSERKWKPKTRFQLFSLLLLRYIPKRKLVNKCYAIIYQDKGLSSDFVFNYFITKAGFKEGIFPADIFESPIDVEFSGHSLMGPTNITKYLKIRYGDYLQLPNEESRKASIHAMIFDTQKGFEEYL